MTRVFKIQEYEFVRNAMDSRLRGNDGVKKIPRLGDRIFYSVACNSARTAVKARARSSIRPFRFALVNSAV